MSEKITGFKPGSKSWKKFMASVYGWGGAVVIVGAMFKIQHWPGASFMLISGLGIEAVIFILSAFDPLHEDPDWSLVYPELAALEDEEDTDFEHDSESLEVAEEDARSITEQLDDLLGDAKIEPELIASLGDGLRSLSDQTHKLGDITDASVATNEYVDNIKSASKNVGELSSTYSEATSKLTSIEIPVGDIANASEASHEYVENLKTASKNIGELGSSYARVSGEITNIDVPTAEANSYAEEVRKMSEHLSNLNSMYVKQIEGSEGALETSAQFYSGISDLVNSLNASIETTKEYKTNIAALSANLSSLNTIYGNMLSAMNPGGQVARAAAPAPTSAPVTTNDNEMDAGDDNE